VYILSVSMDIYLTTHVSSLTHKHPQDKLGQVAE